MRIWLILSVLCLAASTAASDFNNGCGSGWNEPLVPDRIGPLCVDFRAACAVHDNCYSKCLKGGENFGKPICEQSSADAPEGRRTSCDANFKAKMTNSCNACDVVRQSTCKGVAAIYAVAVNVGGRGSFDGAEVPDTYYDFLITEDAQSFDFGAFVVDLESLQRMSAIRDNNRLLLTIQDGKPVASFQSIQTVPAPSVDSSTEVLRIDAIRYGDVDLSKASNGNRTLRLQDIDLKRLDIQKLQNLQRFAPVRR